MSASKHASGQPDQSGKYLTVTLANEAYGIAVLSVREIIRLQKITPLPQVADFIKGVINLRGRVIPIMDLRAKFGLAADFNERTCIVVVQVNRRGGAPWPMGMIVDSVEDVANIPAGEIEPTPELGGAIRTTGLRGMARVDDRVKTLLDIDQVVADAAPAELAVASGG
jgi:purine-binding chemotaxis protein CheW